MYSNGNAPIGTASPKSIEVHLPIAAISDITVVLITLATSDFFFGLKLGTSASMGNSSIFSISNAPNGYSALTVTFWTFFTLSCLTSDITKRPGCAAY